MDTIHAAELLLWMFAFNIKHFGVDFIFQTPYQYKNKGIYGHPGGIIHAGLHGIVTFFILTGIDITLQFCAILSLFDFVVHYHIDWAKMKINQIKGWKCNTTDNFWTLLGFDQFLHYSTYLLIIAIIVYLG